MKRQRGKILFFIGRRFTILYIALYCFTMVSMLFNALQNFEMFQTGDLLMKQCFVSLEDATRRLLHLVSIILRKLKIKKLKGDATKKILLVSCGQSNMRFKSAEKVTVMSQQMYCSAKKQSKQP